MLTPSLVSFHYKTAASGFARSCKTLMLSELYTLLKITHKPGTLLQNNTEKLCGWPGNIVFGEEIPSTRSA